MFKMLRVVTLLYVKVTTHLPRKHDLPETVTLLFVKVTAHLPRKRKKKQFYWKFQTQKVKFKLKMRKDLQSTISTFN